MFFNFSDLPVYPNKFSASSGIFYNMKVYQSLPTNGGKDRQESGIKQNSKAGKSFNIELLNNLFMHNFRITCTMFFGYMT
jgi:hypothetical protein